MFPTTTRIGQPKKPTPKSPAAIDAKETSTIKGRTGSLKPIILSKPALPVPKGQGESLNISKQAFHGVSAFNSRDLGEAVGEDARRSGRLKSREHKDYGKGVVGKTLAATEHVDDFVSSQEQKQNIRRSDRRRSAILGSLLDLLRIETDEGSIPAGAALANVIDGVRKSDPEQVKRVKEKFREHVLKYMEQGNMAADDLKIRETPYSLAQLGDVVSSDAIVATHRQQRKEQPLNYWLNPFDQTGPLQELASRWRRRSDAGPLRFNSTAGRFASEVIPGVAGISGTGYTQQRARNEAARQGIGIDLDKVDYSSEDLIKAAARVVSKGKAYKMKARKGKKPMPYKSERDKKIKLAGELGVALGERFRLNQGR